MVQNLADGLFSNALLERVIGSKPYFLIPKFSVITCRLKHESDSLCLSVNQIN